MGWRVTVVALWFVGALTAFQDASLPVGADAPFMSKIKRFDIHWDRFVRDLLGCPLDVIITSADMCRPMRGKVNYSEFQKSREAAKKLFDLKEAGDAREDSPDRTPGDDR